MALDALKEIDVQKDKIERNTRQFVEGKPANNVLLTGARGTGKSSLIRACLQAYAPQGLRLIEVDKAELTDLPDIIEVVAQPAREVHHLQRRPELRRGRAGLQGAQVDPRRLDRRVDAQRADLRDQQPAPPAARVHEGQPQLHHTEDGEVHPGEVIEEKISLSERFGLWVSFYPFSQNEYLAIVAQWLSSFGVDAKAHRSGAARGAGVGARARLAQRPRGLPVRARLRGARDGLTEDAQAHRGRGRHPDPRGRCAAAVDPARKASPTPATGSSRAASWKPARPSSRRCARTARGARHHDRRGRGLEGHRARLSACAGAPALVQGASRGRRLRDARRARRCAGSNCRSPSTPVLPGALPVLAWLAQERGLVFEPRARFSAG